MGHHTFQVGVGNSAKIELRNLTKSYGKVRALNNVSLEIADKSFTVILGPTSAGKTTLLRLIAGLEKPDQGKIVINGKDITSLKPGQRNVALVFQSFALWPHMTAYENIASPLRAHKVPQNEVDKRVREVARFLKIENLLHKKPPYLSGGERQRVAIARVLVKQADVYLFDEPLTNLDYKIRESMRGELKRIFREVGATIVYASPDPLDAFAMSQYTAFLNEGNVLQFAQTQEVLAKPARSLIARYFSFPEANVLSGEIKEADGRLMFVSPVISVDLTKYRGVIEAGREYTMCIRAKDVHIVTGMERRDPEIITFAAKGLISEVIGSESIVHTQLNGQKILAYLPTIAKIVPGEEMTLSFDVNKIFLFDSEDNPVIYAQG